MGRLVPGVRVTVRTAQQLGQANWYISFSSLSYRSAGVLMAFPP
jgi:hypothetical protein